MSVPRINNVVGANADGKRHIATLKTNIHKPVSAAFAITEAEVTANGVTVKAPRVEWIQGAATVTADDLMGAKKQDEKKAKRNSVEDLAKEWLQNNLGEAGKPATEVIDHLKRTFQLSEKKVRELANIVGVRKFKTKEVPSRSMWACGTFGEWMSSSDDLT